MRTLNSLLRSMHSDDQVNTNRPKISKDPKFMASLNSRSRTTIREPNPAHKLIKLQTLGSSSLSRRSLVVPSDKNPFNDQVFEKDRFKAFCMRRNICCSPLSPPISEDKMEISLFKGVGETRPKEKSFKRKLKEGQQGPYRQVLPKSYTRNNILIGKGLKNPFLAPSATKGPDPVNPNDRTPALDQPTPQSPQEQVISEQGHLPPESETPVIRQTSKLSDADMRAIFNVSRVDYQNHHSRPLIIPHSELEGDDCPALTRPGILFTPKRTELKIPRSPSWSSKEAVQHFRPRSILKSKSQKKSKKHKVSFEVSIDPLKY